MLEKLLVELKAKGIRLILQGGKLEVKSNKKIASADLLKIQQVKEIVLTYLTSTSNKRFLADNQQRRLWNLERQYVESPRYNQALPFHIEEKMDEYFLRDSLRKVVLAFPQLRLRFQEVEGQLHKFHDLSPKCIQLDLIDLPNHECTGRNRLKEYVQKPFDLVTGPCFRLGCLRSPSTKQDILVLVMHQIIGDYSSMATFMRELMKAYAGQPISQRAFEQQRKTIREKATSVHYWLNNLRDVQPLSFLENRTCTPSTKGRTVSINFSVANTNKMLRFCADMQVHPAVLLQTSLQFFLHNLSKERDFIIATPLDTRDEVTEDGVIANFTRLFPIRESISTSNSLEEALKKVELSLAKIMHYKHIHCQRLRSIIKKQNTWSVAFPPYQVLFHYINSVNFLNNALPSLRPVSFERGIADLDLSFQCILDAQGLIFQLEYRNELFDDKSGMAILIQFTQLCKKLVDTKGAAFLTKAFA